MILNRSFKIAESIKGNDCKLVRYRTLHERIASDTELSKLNIHCQHMFIGRLGSGDDQPQDVLFIAFTRKDPIECVLLGTSGYFANRASKMLIVGGSLDDIAGHIFDILNGDVKIDDGDTHYPSYIKEYVKFHAETS